MAQADNVKELLGVGADKNCIGEGGATPLFVASQKGLTAVSVEPNRSYRSYGTPCTLRTY